MGKWNQFYAGYKAGLSLGEKQLNAKKLQTVSSSAAFCNTHTHTKGRWDLMVEVVLLHL